MSVFFIIILVLVAAALFAVAILIEVFWGAFPLLFWGAIYVATPDEKVEKMIRLLDIKPGQKFADLGAGNGKLVVAAAKAGAEAHGYEINPFLVAAGRKTIRQVGLEGKAFMHYKSLWKQNVKDFDSIAIYAMNHMMKGLEKKFNLELKPGAKVVSNHFTFPEWKPAKEEGNIRLYIKS